MVDASSNPLVTDFCLPILLIIFPYLLTYSSNTKNNFRPVVSWGGTKRRGLIHGIKCNLNAKCLTVKMSIAISYKIYHLYNSRQRQQIIIGQLSYYGSRQRLKKLPLKMSKKNSFCCILYCKAHKGCLKTEIYVLLHRLKKCIVNRHPAMQNSKPR